MSGSGRVRWRLLHLIRGVDRTPPSGEHGFTEPGVVAMPQPPSAQPSHGDAMPDLDDRTRALCELRSRMLELVSQLEYLRLMLKLGVR